MHTGSDLAQLLERPEAAVSEIMGSIIIDPRHTDVRIISQQNIEERSFPDWGMALADKHLETLGAIERLSGPYAEAAAADAAEALMGQMSLGASARV